MPCLVCGRPTGKQTRCPDHPAPRKTQVKANTTERGLGSAHKRKSKQVRAEHVRRFGWICPGYNRPPHYSTDLTADHVTPRAKGGTTESPYVVLCRSCNSSRGAG